MTLPASVSDCNDEALAEVLKDLSIYCLSAKVSHVMLLTRTAGYQERKGKKLGYFSQGR